MPINFRKAKQGCNPCTSCGSSWEESVDMYEYRIGKQSGVLCDVCLKEMFSKSLKVTTLIDGETKDERQIRVKNERSLKMQKSSNMSINEALRGVRGDKD